MNKWTVAKGNQVAVLVDDGSGQAGVIAFADGLEQAQTNARLIAAAPDLLEACKMALKEWHSSLDGCAAPDCLVCVRHEKEKEQVKAAIAKAEQK